MEPNVPAPHAPLQGMCKKLKYFSIQLFDRLHPSNITITYNNQWRTTNKKNISARRG